MLIASNSESVPVGNLRPHPENALIFGAPEDSEGFDALVASLRKYGQMEPLVAKADGTVLAGHRRLAALTALKVERALVRIATCESYRDELEVVVRSNTDRRQLGPREIAFAFKRLKETPREQGGAKGKKGGDTRSEKAREERDQSGGIPTLKARDEAASMLGVNTDTARALEAVFTDPAVPEELKAAVDKGKIKPTPAAEAVRAEKKRQGGEIVNPEPLKAWAEQKATPKPRAAEKDEHEVRVEERAKAFREAQAELLDIYKRIDRVLSRVPLKSVIGPTEHHEYAALIRDVSLRAWREIESVQGPTNAGRQMALVAIEGGKP